MNIGFLGPAVATVLTVYGIETSKEPAQLPSLYVATVLTVYGIETSSSKYQYAISSGNFVATVLTVYGIETL